MDKIREAWANSSSNVRIAIVVGAVIVIVAAMYFGFVNEVFTWLG